MAISVGEIEAVLKLRDEFAAQISASISTYQKLDSALGEIDKSVRKVESGIGTLGVAMGTFLGGWIEKAADAIIGFGKEAIATAARVETLAGVARYMGEQSGFTREQVDFVTESLRKQGITTAQSNDTVIQLTRANLGLSNATNLAAVAQSAARASGENSSVTLSRLIQGIQTLQPEILRTSGIIVSSDIAYRKYAEAHSLVATRLTGSQKQQAMLNAVLLEGNKIAGIYGVTNEFVGGKMQSLARYQEEAGLAIGNFFLPALRIGIDVLTQFLKAVATSPKFFTEMALGIVVVSTALSVSWAVPVAAAVVALDLLMGAFTGTLDPMTNMKALLEALSEALSFGADATKLMTFGLVDWKTAVANADMIGVALKVTVLSLAAIVLEFAISVNKAAIATNALGYAMPSLNKVFKDNIADLTEMKAKLSDSANATLASLDATVKHATATKKSKEEMLAAILAAEKLAREQQTLKDKLEAAGAAAAAQVKAFDALVKKYKEAHTAAGQAAVIQKELNVIFAATGGVMKMTQHDLLEATGVLSKMGTEGQAAGRKLVDSWEDVHKTMVLVGRELKLTVPGLDAVKMTATEEGKAFVLAEQAKYNKLFETNSAIAKQAAAMLALGQITPVVYDKIVKDLGVTAAKTTVTTKATFDWQKALQQVNDTMQILGVSSTSILGQIVGGIGLAVSGYQAWKTATDNVKNATTDADKSAAKHALTVQRITAAFQAATAAASIYQQNSKNMSGTNAALSGAATGAKAGAAFGPYGIIIGAVAGALIGFFSGKGFRDMASSAGKVLGVEMTKELALKIEATMKSLKVNVKTASLLNIDEAMKSSGKGVTAFSSQIDGLFKLLAQGGAVGEEAFKDLDGLFQAAASGAAKFDVASKKLTQSMFQQAIAAGRLTESMMAYAKTQLDTMAGGSSKILEGVSMISSNVPLGAMGTAAAQMFTAGFVAEMANKGIVQALVDSGDKIGAFYEKLTAEGNVGAAAMLAPFQQLAAVINNETDPSVKGFLLTLQGMGEVFTGLDNMGFVTADAFHGLELGIQGTVNALSEAGVVGPAALMAIAPQLGQVLAASQQYGFALDANTQSLIDQANAAGIAFPTDPMQVMIGLLGQIVVLMGGTLPAAMAALPPAAEAAFGGIRTSAESAAGAVAGSMDTMIGGVSSAVNSLTPEIAGAMNALATDTSSTLQEMASSIANSLGSTSDAAVGDIQKIAGSINALQGKDLYVNVRQNTEYTETRHVNTEYTESKGRESFASGSKGIRDFGTGTPAMLHGEEIVATRDQMDKIISTALNGGSGSSGMSGKETAYNVTVNVAGDGDAAKIKRVVLDALRNEGGFRGDVARHLDSVG